MLLFLFWFGLALSAMAPADASDVDYGQTWATVLYRQVAFVPTPMTWADAEKYCVTLGGHLMSIHNLLEQEYLAYLVNNPHKLQYAWIGLTDIKKEGVWEWSDGSKVDYVFWSKNQPDNYKGAEHCIHTHGNSKATWNDEHCSRKYPFVCAKPQKI